MTDDGSRRFTDREVALILRNASDIEEKEGLGAAGGLSLAELRDIAREVGISQEAMDRAVGELNRKHPSSAWAGAPLVRRTVRAVDGRLNPTGVARLMRLVDEQASGAGSVTEALGAVRWTSNDRFSSMQVSVTPEGDQTTIQVVEKARPRVKRIMHFVPAAWGVMLAMPTMAQAGGVATAGMVAMGAVAAVVGAGLGRMAWTLSSNRSANRVGALAAELSREAESASAEGLVEPDGRSEEP